jgi:hypothetical protein
MKKIKAKNNSKNVWIWETCKFTLSNPKGETIELNSLHINDFKTFVKIYEKYVKETHKGLLE